MSEQNVETARVGFEAWADRDLDRLIELSDPECELRAPIALGRVYRGHSGIKAYMADFYDAWETVGWDFDELETVGAVVLFVGRLRLLGRTSGIAVDSPMSWLFELRDGKIVRFEAFRDPEQAREAAGLD